MIRPIQYTFVSTLFGRRYGSMGRWAELVCGVLFEGVKSNWCGLVAKGSLNI